ncbi:MAG: aldo/keto reductase [Pseudomonadota bacterium]
MRMTKLGRTGIDVSDICLGTMTWGTQNTEAEAHAQIERALERAVNFLDTAEMYPTTPPGRETQGLTETYIGTWLAKSGRRDEVVIATKIIGKGSRTVRDGGAITPEAIKIAVEDSRMRLQTDVIDLYQLHWPNRGSYSFRQNWTYSAAGKDYAAIRDDLKSTLEALAEEQAAGRIAHIGVSNDTAWGMMTMLRLSDELGLPRIQSVQNEYGLMYRQFDLDLAELALAEDVPLLAYSPLAAGILTGKYRGGVVPAGSRRDVSSGNLGGRVTERAPLAVEAYAKIAERHDISLTKLAIAFARSRPFMGSVIIGATSLEQLDEVLDAGEIDLSEEILAEIDEAHKAHPWPY